MTPLSVGSAGGVGQLIENRAPGVEARNGSAGDLGFVVGPTECEHGVEIDDCAEGGSLAVVHHPTLFDQRLEAAGTEPRPVRRVGGDEVALRVGMERDEAADPWPEDGCDQRAAAPGVGIHRIGIHHRAEVVHEPAGLELDVVGYAFGEQRRALQAVGEEIESLLVVDPGPVGQQRAQLVDGHRDTYAGGGR